MSKKKQVPESEAFDFEKYKKEVIAGLISGKGLTGEDGLLKPLIKQFVEGALSAELDSHLKEEKAAEHQNRRNGLQSKEIKTDFGPVQIEYSRDRRSSFEPVTVKKRQYELGVGFTAQILELYAMGNSLSDIELHLRRIYGAELSESRISSVVNATWEQVETWRKRPLPALLVVLFIDAVHLQVRRQGAVQTIALYVMYGITAAGKREIIALIPGQGAESATEWARCLESLRQRGLEDVLITCSDGLAGLKDVIQQAFSQTMIQRCMVHKIRNTFRLLDDKDSRKVLRQLKEVYSAVNEAEADRLMQDFQLHWEGKYDTVVHLWRKDWTEIMGCMKLSPALKKIVYTTNAIENLNREIRRVTKTKGAWVSDRALLIQLFLALDRRKKSWNKSVRGWPGIIRELTELYGERFTKHINQA